MIEMVTYCLHGVLIFQIVFIICQFFITKRTDFLFYALYALVAVVYFVYMQVNQKATGGAYPDFSKASGIGLLCYAELFQWLPILIYVVYMEFMSHFLNIPTIHPKVQQLIRTVQKWILVYVLVDLSAIVVFRQPVPGFVYQVCAFLVLLYVVRIFVAMYRVRDQLINYILVGSIIAATGSFVSTILILWNAANGISDIRLPILISYIGVGLELLVFSIAFMYKAALIEWEKKRATEALYRMESRNKQLQLNIHEMRNKISADLHDQVGSTLYSVSLYSQMARKQLAPEGDVVQNPLLAADIMDKIAVASKTMLSEMNDIVWTLNPMNDSGNKLADRMIATANNLILPLNVQLDLQLNFDHSLDNMGMEKRKNLYLVYKEILTNAAKHAQMTAMSIQSMQERSRLTIVIKDNGKGFDSSKATTGNGLGNMQRRMQEIDGQLIFETAPSKGTTISIIVGLP
jgi:signal transduction histidine kinase